MAEVVSLQLEEDQSGEEAMMQDFVRLHMMSMLQPFAERVQVIQEHVKLLQDAQHQSLGQVKHLEGCSAAQSEELQKLSEEVQRHKEQLEAQQLELATVKKERNRLEGNHEITKASVAKAREMAEELAELVEKLREQQKGSMEKLELCHTEWQELDKRLVERFDTRLDKQGRVCKELNEKQLELQKNHLSLSLEALKEGLETSSRGHQAAAHELREELEGLKEELLQRSKAWADTNREVHHLQTWAEELRQLQQLTEKQDVAQAELQAQQQRLAQLEQRLSDILLRPDHEGSALRDELELVQKQLQQFSAEVLKGKDQQKAHVDLLSSASNRLHDLEGELPRLHEQLNECKGEVEDLATWRTDSSQVLQGTQRSLSRAEAQLGEMQGRVKELGTGYEEVRQEQGSTRESLTKMSVETSKGYEPNIGALNSDGHGEVPVGAMQGTGQCQSVLLRQGPKRTPSSRTEAWKFAC
ncbi:unnamed protein product [Cladocopium goreaui]|uniref:Uncharacterized protein n=1 Tax=Cladocopium goreaui TaxID=2562237 RepID=A0A9P1BNT7_9DINO|nr:unnamed protein product [Cladocopium goreaui]